MIAQKTIRTCGVKRKFDLFKAFVKIDSNYKIKIYFQQTCSSIRWGDGKRPWLHP